MGLELWTVVNVHVGTGNQIQVFYKNNCSELTPTHLSSSHSDLFNILFGRRVSYKIPLLHTYTLTQTLPLHIYTHMNWVKHLEGLNH